MNKTEKAKETERPNSHTFLASLQNAWRGMLAVIRGERNFRLQLMVAIAATILAALLNFPSWKWSILILTIGLVLTSEAFNSALETLVDLIQPEYHPLAGRAKDIAAGAVLIASIISVIIGVLLYGPPMYELLLSH